MPTIALTDQLIRSLKPPSDAPQTDYRDQKCAGLVLRVSAKSKRWNFVYSLAGKRRRAGIGPYGTREDEFTLKEAREKADHFRALVRDGLDPSLEREQTIRENTTETVREMLALRLRNMREDGRSAAYIDDFRRLIEGRVLPRLGDVPIRQVTLNDLARIFSQLRKEGLAKTHNKLRTTLPTLWKVARVPYPGEYDIRPMKQNASPDPFSVSELCALLKAARETETLSPMARLAIQFGMFTLKRRGEIALAKVSEIDFVAGQWTIPPAHSKAGRGEVIPLSPQALSVLNEALNHPARLDDRDDPNRPLFVNCRDWAGPLSADNVTKTFPKLKAAAGLPKDNRTLHVLRHSGATALAASETPPYIVSALLGHSFSGAGAAVTSRYNQYSFLSERRDALLRLGGMIAPETSLERLQRPESVPVAVSETIQ